MIIGIDIGSTTTKAVSIQGGRVIHKIKTKALDAVTSATGAFGKMTVENGIKIGDIKRIMITGAGATKLKNDLFGIPTGLAGEIESIGIGGMFLAGRDNIIITNIGTGTVIIEARSDGISHLGGSGVGGGTILGLAKKLLSTSEFSDIMKLAERGRLNQVDLLLEDIMETDLSFLNKESTASNFGKMLDGARNEDIALGLLNMVYQVIGMLSVFAAQRRNTGKVVVTGNGSKNLIGRRVFGAITEIYNVGFEYPEDAEYTTAIGAALSWERNL
ncbi:MAG: pantothenate kinase [Spirochaetaceae bacterium]|jgi:type II pantothenate kinase|nr:pantothenate kinase [Spirochaetaceae bacterium]